MLRWWDDRPEGDGATLGNGNSGEAVERRQSDRPHRVGLNGECDRAPRRQALAPLDERAD